MMNQEYINYRIHMLRQEIKFLESYSDKEWEDEDGTEGLDKDYYLNLSPSEKLNLDVLQYDIKDLVSYGTSKKD